MTRDRALVAAAVGLLTLLTYFQFPGHTFLQADTQIYIPILEHLRDPSVLDRELIAQNPHVSFTIYDETARLLRRITGLSFRAVLTAEQLIFRALAIYGVFLLGTALGLRKRLAMLVAAVFSLGATIGGPSVLTFEYEPVPRGFAIPLLFLAIGLAAHGRDIAAGIAAAVAFLYHPPTVLPFWAVYFCLTLIPSKATTMRRRILGLLPILAGVLILLVLAKSQAGIAEKQPFFSTIGPFIEKLQRLRASYNWVSMWPAAWKTHYAILFAACVLAFWRVRRFASLDFGFFALGLPLIGMLSMPVAYYLLEELHWWIMPQVQITRALLFVTAFACILGAAAAMKAGIAGRHWEAFLWFVLVFALPMNLRIQQVLLPNLSDAIIRPRFITALLCAGLATFAVWAEMRKKSGRRAIIAAAALVPFFLLPGYAKVVNYPDLDSADLGALVNWACTSTPKDAMFLFPDAGQQLYPGIFRAESLRAVYVDWKAGGQVNFLKAFSREWWSRWQQTMTQFPPTDPGIYARLGIDFVVVKKPDALAGFPVAYRNPTFTVYRTRSQP